MILEPNEFKVSFGDFQTLKGDPGKDGVSASHSWNGTVLTITSASGTSSADLKGPKGDSLDGKGYLTEENAKEIYQPKGNFLTESQMKTINGESLVGEGDVSVLTDLSLKAVYLGSGVVQLTIISMNTNGGNVSQTGSILTILGDVQVTQNSNTLTIE